MNYDEFRSAFFVVLKRAMFFWEKARREGMLALEECCDLEKAVKRDIFEYGMQFVIDGYDRKLIDKILSNIVNQEKDEYARTLKLIQKEAVLSIQAGDNPRILVILLNSYTDIPLDDPEIKAMLAD